MEQSTRPVQPAADPAGWAAADATGRPAADAAEALRLVQADPAQAQRRAAAALAGAQARGDLAAASTAERALGMVAFERHELGRARRHLQAALAAARRAAAPTLVGQARMSLSLVLAYQGRTRAALRQADAAASVLRGPDAARLAAQRALILQRTGRTEAAMAAYRRAVPALRRAGDQLWEARALCNRGVLHAYRGALAAAQADLERAERLAADLGQGMIAVAARENLGFVATCRGDVPAALAAYDAAERGLEAEGLPTALLSMDRAEVLLSVRLVDEAVAAAGRAVRELAGLGMASDLAEARLLASAALLVAGDVGAARASAELARRAFDAQGRPAWSALARYAALRAAWAAGDHSPAAVRAARRAAERLDVAGWTANAVDARVIAARGALALGRAKLAGRLLAEAGGWARRQAPAELRARAWHAKALLRLHAGDRRGAAAALRAGLRVLDGYQAALPAAELRVRAAGLSADLATAGLTLAIEDGDPRRLLAWAERHRAGALRLRPPRPPGDDAMAADLVELRAVVAELDGLLLGAGRGHGSPAQLHRARRLRARQAELERSIARRARRARPSGASRAAPAASPAELGAALGELALVELVEVGGRLHAVTLAGGRARRWELGQAGEAAAELGWLRFALRRLAAGHGSPRSLAAAADAAGHAAARLDAMVMAPVAAAVGDRALVIVPTGELHGVPWAALPSCRARPVTVAPSAALWHRAATAPAPVGWEGAFPSSGRVVLVAGPGVPAAEGEVAALGEVYPGALALTGPAASVAAVREALDGCELAHVAAHGNFRADNPLFSAIGLADGPLVVHDLDRLARAPGVMVLGACDSAAAAVDPGDELTGLAAALLGLGTRALVASVVPVPDEPTRDLLLAVHRGLAGGRRPAEALATAAAEVAGAGTGPAGMAAWAGFVCLGAG